MTAIEQLQGVLIQSGFKAVMVNVDRNGDVSKELDLYCFPGRFTLNDEQAGGLLNKIQTDKLGHAEIASLLLASQYPQESADVWRRVTDAED